MRRAAAPMPENEHRRQDGDIFQRAAIPPILSPADDAVLHALKRDGRRTWNGAGSDRELVLAQESQPIPQRDAAQQPGAEVEKEGLTPRHVGVPSQRIIQLGPMHKGRLEAFSDGVIAVLITIMVLE